MQSSSDAAGGGGSTLRSKYTRTTNTSHIKDFDTDDENELKDFKHLPKDKAVEATQQLFVKKVEQLTFPKNPTLFGKEQQMARKLAKRSVQSRNSQFRTV